MQANITILGSGTSMGVPTLGCECRVCRSTDPRDRRSRPSIAIEFNGHRALIDTGPDFYHQALREDIRSLDAVFYTHPHADHILGLDDLRPLSFLLKGRMPLYADAATAETIRRVFAYTFNDGQEYPHKARVELVQLGPAPGDRVTLFEVEFIRIPVLHGRLEISGYRFANCAYLTDTSEIPESSYSLLQNLDVLILDALRPTPHPSHSHIERSIGFVQRIQPRRAFFTHMSHDVMHAEIEATLPAPIRLAYDGLRIPFEIAPFEID